MQGRHSAFQALPSDFMLLEQLRMRVLSGSCSNLKEPGIFPRRSCLLTAILTPPDSASLLILVPLGQQ